MSVFAKRSQDATTGTVVKRAQGGSDFDLDRLVALCPPCHAQTDAAYVRGRLVITPRGGGQFTCKVIRGADKWATRGDGSRRWPVLHHEAEELRVHHRTTIASDDTQAVVRALLATGPGPLLQPTLLGIQRNESLATMGLVFIRGSSGADAFGKLSRYEAAIERGFFRASHELQRLQLARRGGHVPPRVALDVTVSGVLAETPESTATE